MYKRLQKLTFNYSFFLFGPRGSGKSTLISNLFSTKSAHFIDLLDDEQERRFALYPNELAAVAAGLKPDQKYLVIDEIQKVPKLLDIVHQLVEKKTCLFALTGSSARKLKLAVFHRQPTRHWGQRQNHKIIL